VDPFFFFQTWGLIFLLGVLVRFAEQSKAGTIPFYGHFHWKIDHGHEYKEFFFPIIFL
jgi:hypothetical protein